MPNLRSHREEHRTHAQALVLSVRATHGRKPTGEEFQQLRRVVATRRRDEQRRARETDPWGRQRRSDRRRPKA